MNNQEHESRLIGICLSCKTYFCEVCFTLDHLSHYYDTALIHNFIYLGYLNQKFTGEIIQNTYEIIPSYAVLMNELSKQNALTSTFIADALDDKISNYSIEFFLSLAKRSFNDKFIQCINDENIFNEKQKKALIDAIYEEAEYENQDYLKLKYSDLHCLLLKQGKYEEAEYLYKNCIQNQIQQSLLYDSYHYELMIKTIQQEKNNLIIIHEALQKGRNLYLINEDQRCIDQMNKILQDDEQKIVYDQALIYRGLSLLRLKKYSEALKSFEKVQNEYLIMNKLFYCITLEKLGLLEEAFIKYNALVQRTFMPEFQEPLCYLLFLNKKFKELKSFCDNTLQIDPKNYTALLYKAIYYIHQEEVTKEVYDIAEKMIDLQFHKIEGHVIKCILLILSNEFTQLLQYKDTLIKFNNDGTLKYLVSIVLFFVQDFDRAYELLTQIPTSHFPNIFERVNLEVSILMCQKDFHFAFIRLMDTYSDDHHFYQVFQIFCHRLDLYNLNEQAYQFIVEQNVDQSKSQFVNILLGKTLLEMKQPEKALKYFTEFQHDKSGSKLSKYYEAQTLLELNRFEDAADSLLAAFLMEPEFISYPFNFVFYKCVFEIMYGRFDEAEKFGKFVPHNQLTKVKFLKGFLFWIKGEINQAQHMLQDNQMINQFPLVKIIISWILLESGLTEAPKILVDQVQKEYPGMKQFNDKYHFFTNGPYSDFMKRNKDMFNTFDEKKFFNIKFIAIFFEIYGFDKLQIDLGLNIILKFTINLTYQQFKQQEKKQDKIIENYPFV